MPLSRARDYLSIGEVLEAVRDDFPDVSISKIRFLESEGLISPERTASGYRKFYGVDVERLRYILALQRDQFLPLRVIKERLAQADGNGGGFPAVEARPPAPEAPAANGAPANPADLTGVALSRTELQDAAGLSQEELAGLEEFGILEARDTYDENDLMVATAARRFFAHGVEPRHLKMYRQFAEREASFFEQIVTPVAHRKDPSAHRHAAEAVQELLSLSRQIREGALRSSLREHL